MADHVQDLKQRVCEAVDRKADELTEAADWIHAHPEIGHQEVQAAERLTGLLRGAGIRVETGHGRHEHGVQGRTGRRRTRARARGSPFWPSTTRCPGSDTAVATT